MKRILALMLAMLMLCFALAACSDKEEEEGGETVDLTVTDSDSVFNTKNEHNDQFYYDYINGDEVIITGYAGSHVPHAVTVPDVIDERPVTAIGNCAFMSKTNVTEIALPATVNSIGVAAFAKCTNLTKINVPDAVVTVGDSAFQETAIAEIKLPATLVTLGENVFANCVKLTKAELPAGKVHLLDASTDPATEYTVNVIPKQLFFGCVSLSEVNWLTKADRIDAYAFANCKVMTTVPTLSDTATSIGTCAFLNCAKITAMAIPTTVSEIGECAFYGCESLASVTFANTTTAWTIKHEDSNKPMPEDAPASADAAVNADNLTGTYAAYKWTWKVIVEE